VGELDRSRIERRRVLQRGEQLEHAALVVGDQLPALGVVGLRDGVGHAVDVLHQPGDTGQQDRLLALRCDREERLPAQPATEPVGVQQVF
jgi:hypothetical protein